MSAVIGRQALTLRTLAKDANCWRESEKDRVGNCKGKPKIAKYS